MKDTRGYGQFCPVARAAEIVASRWTPILLRELICGSTRFNELRAGVPRMSPALLSKRLGELEDAGIVRKLRPPTGKGFEYRLTEIGKELKPFVMGLGAWGQRYVIKELAETELDPGLLMWDIHRRLDSGCFPEKGHFVAEFCLRGVPARRRTWWIVIEDREVDLCVQAPGREIDLYVESGLRDLTNIWMGKLTIEEAKRKSLLLLKGEERYARSFKKWFTLSVFAGIAPVA